MGKTLRQRPINTFNKNQSKVENFLNNAMADQHLYNRSLKEIKLVKAFRLKKELIREFEILAAKIDRTESDLLTEGINILLEKYLKK
jgi:hypothetical protein